MNQMTELEELTEDKTLTELLKEIVFQVNEMGVLVGGVIYSHFTDCIGSKIQDQYTRQLVIEAIPRLIQKCKL